MANPEQAQQAIQRVKELGNRTALAPGWWLINQIKPDDYLGSGTEKDVFKFGDNRAIAFLRRTNVPAEMVPKLIKSFYYSSSLAHLLLPDNFPNSYLGGSQPPVLIVDRIQAATGPEGVVDYEDRNEFRHLLRPLGIEEAVDLSEGNLLKDQNGQLIYVDIVNPSMMINNHRLDAYIDNLPPSQVARARRFQRQLVINSID